MSAVAELDTQSLPDTAGGGSGVDRLGRAVRLALIVFAIAAIAFLVANAFNYYYIGKLGQEANLAIGARDFDRALLEMRRNEKDFFIRRQQSDLDLHAQNFERSQQVIKDLVSNDAATAEDIGQFEEWNKNLTDYRKSFLQSADAYLAKGLNAESGTNKELRETSVMLADLVAKSGLLQLENALNYVRAESRDFVIFEQEKFVTQFHTRIAAFQQILAGSSLDAGAKAKIEEALKQYAAAFDRNADLTFKGLKARDTARGFAREAEKDLPAFTEKATERRAAARATVIRTIVVTVIALMAVFIGLGWLLRNAQKGANQTFAERLAGQQKAEAENEQLNNSVVSILQAVNSLSQRDLTVKAPVTQDVIGTVSDSINALTEETSKVLHGVTNIAGQVEQVSGNVKAQADNVTRTAEQERQNVNQMMESLLDATQTMNQVAALTDQSSESAEQATIATENALTTVNDTVKGMESIRETIAETEKRIKRLGERSQEISGIVNLINTISERTHVLALNASMQAAVAGEAGRGFAVVAEEVQRLAESSRNATQQIGTLVNNIQLETNETISTVNRTIGQVVQGSEQAQRAGEQMRRTQEITAQLVAQVRSIANASEQQKSMSVNLLEAVQRMGESTEQTAQQIEAQNKETDTLLQASRRLVESVSVFKLPQMA